MKEMWVRSLGWEDLLGQGNGNPLQYSCLGNPTDRGAWWAIVLGVVRIWTPLSNQTTTTWVWIHANYSRFLCFCFLIFTMGIIRTIPTMGLLWRWNEFIYWSWFQYTDVEPFSCVGVLRPSGWRHSTPWKMGNHKEAEDARKFLDQMLRTHSPRNQNLIVESSVWTDAWCIHVESFRRDGAFRPYSRLRNALMRA